MRLSAAEWREVARAQDDLWELERARTAAALAEVLAGVLGG